MTTSRYEPANERENIERVIVQCEMSGESAEAWRAIAYSNELKLFIVENTGKKRALFLAETAMFARHLALKAGHILELSNGIVLIPNDLFFREKQGFEGAVKKAITNRKPGLLEEKGEFAIVDGEVFTPIRIV